MPGDYQRIHRLLELITLLRNERGWNTSTLAERYGCSERSIYRDLEALKELAVPCHYDETTGDYRIRRDFFLPPVHLTLEEALAVIALGRRIGEREQIPFMAPAAKAMTKLRGQLPSKLREPLERVEDHVDIRLAAAGSADGVSDVYEQVRRAIAYRRALRCSYESLEAKDNPDRAEEVFLFYPYHLLFSQRAWYAVGHHDGRGAVRKLKLQRFTLCEETEREFEIPVDFSLEDQLGRGVV